MVSFVQKELFVSILVWKLLNKFMLLKECTNTSLMWPKHFFFNKMFLFVIGMNVF